MVVAEAPTVHAIRLGDNQFRSRPSSKLSRYNESFPAPSTSRLLWAVLSVDIVLPVSMLILRYYVARSKTKCTMRVAMQPTIPSESRCGLTNHPWTTNERIVRRLKRSNSRTDHLYILNTIVILLLIFFILHCAKKMYANIW